MENAANEVTLLKECLKGNTNAFEGIVTQYQELVCAITYSGTADVQLSEELAHQTFINAWNKLSQLRDLSKFRPWLCTIARNHVNSFIRKNKRDVLQKAKPMEYINDMAADESGPLESAIKKEHKELVDSAIAQVPEQYRESLILYYRQQQSVKQVAQLLDLPEETVKKHLQRGRKMIKEQVSSIVEETLSATGPKKVFAIAVVASIAVLAAKGSAAAAAGVAAEVSTAGTTTGAAAAMSGITAKIITAAAVVAVGVGAVVTYKHLTKPQQEPGLPQAEMIAQEKEKQSARIAEEITEQSNNWTKVSHTSPVITNNLDTKESGDLATEIAQKANNGDSTESEADSAPARSDDKIIVGGFVKSIDGEPIAGVDVQLFWDVMRGMPMLDGEDTITDANGMWQCQITGESEDITIRLKHPEYLSQYYDYRPSFDDLIEQSAVLMMSKGLQVSGFVHDTQGNPVSNAIIMPPRSITGTSAVHGIQDSAKTTRTDVNGEFLLKAVGTGLQDIAVDAKGYAPAFVSVNMTPGIPPIEIVLDKGSNLAGVVTDINGEPLFGVKVKIDDWNYKYKEGTNDYRSKRLYMLRRQSVTDDAGQYTIEHLPPVGEVKIAYVKRPGFLVSYIKYDMGQDKRKDVTMYPIPTITGTVVDADSGKPITEFEVAAACTWDPNNVGVWRPNTDKVRSPQGNFSKTKSNFTAHQLPSPGWVAVKISAKGYHSANSPWMRIDQEFTPITIRLKKTQILSSTLFYSDGTPVSNTDVVIIEPSSRVYVRNGKIDKGVSNSEYSIIQADPNGCFEFSAPASPTKILVLDYDEYLVADTNDLKNQLTLTPWAYVTGVVDTDNGITSNITVEIEPDYDTNKQIRWTSKQTTNANGQFEFFYIPAIPQEIRYGSAGNTNARNKRIKINPRPNQELQLRLGNIQPVDPNVTSIE